MDEEMLIEILKEAQKKYQCVVEIERITREIGDSLARNDRTSVQLLLGMRQEEMDQVDRCDRSMNYIVSALPSMEAACVRGWLKGNREKPPESPMAVKLLEKGETIRQLLKRTTEIDRHISSRLAGSDSYYK